jgi:EAL and modified HD-GYP domain-containing signal transduction protein
VERLLPLAWVVKLDFMADPLERLREIVEMLRPYGVELLAEKVETEADFRAGLELGCRYFQGYFFAKPVIIQREELPPATWSQLRIMGAIQRPEIEVDEMARIIATDPALTYKLLQLVNSAAFGLERKVSSIQQALVILGERELRRWLTFVILSSLSGDRPKEVMVLACTRGRFAELLAGLKGRQDMAPSLFLTGLLSMLGVIVGRPLKELLADLPLDPAIGEALLEGKGPLAPYYYLGLAYEQGKMSAVYRLVDLLELDVQQVGECYIEAVKWADTFLAE